MSRRDLSPKFRTRFRLDLEYLGTQYRGWQIQKNARTVQGDLSRAIADAVGTHQFELVGAGRTDAGVHALHQVAHLAIDTAPPPEILKIRINQKLPSDINVLRVRSVSRRFHARHDAVSRSYLYQLSTRRTAFGKKLVWWVQEALDVNAMQLAAQEFLGMKDFRSFSADRPEEKSTEVLIERLQLAAVAPMILIRVEGSHFLWRMVRRLVGVLVEVGRGGLSIPDVREFLVRESPTPAQLTAPASGLFLERVYYRGDSRLGGISPVLRLADFE